MKKISAKRIGVLASIVASLVMTTMVGCSKVEENTASVDGVKSITVAYADGFKPITYTNENGEADGYDVAVMKKIDEMLTEYEFTFTSVEKDTMNIGVETGTYQIGINGMFKNSERLSKYIMTENMLGASTMALVVAEGNSSLITLENVFDTGAKMAPIQSSSGVYAIVENYNSANPTKKIVYEAVSEQNRAENYRGVASGQYDAHIELSSVFNGLPAEITTGVQLNEPFTSVGTYPIINKDETELAASIDTALKTLRDDGTLSKLAEQYYGMDVFKYAQ